jgi:hypothetical protein
MRSDTSRHLSSIFNDLRSGRLDVPQVVDEDWMNAPGMESFWLRFSDGSIAGIRVDLAATPAEQCAWIADQIQEYVIDDQLQGTDRTNWPPCPLHPRTHPLTPVAVGEQAAWTCLIALVEFPIGHLPGVAPGSDTH